MRIKCYCNLYTGKSLANKKTQQILELMNGNLSPFIHIITLAQGRQNHLEIFASSLLRQHIYDDKEIFIVGLAGKYDEAVNLVAKIAQNVLNSTGTTDIRGYIETEQKSFEEGRK